MSMVTLPGSIMADMEAADCRESLAEFVRRAWDVVEPGTPLVWNWHLDALCNHVQALYEGKLPARKMTINVPPGSAKPVSIKSMVIEQRRGRVQISEIGVGDSVLTHKGRFRRVLAVHEQGILPLLEIRTASGRVLRLAHDHPLLTARGWVEAGAITTRDVLAIVTPQESCGSPTLPLEEARALGYLVGDGCTSQNWAASFTNGDAESIADFIACIETLGFGHSMARHGRSSNVVVKGGHGAITGISRSQRKGVVGPVREWVRKHGLEGSTSYTKRVPAQVMAGNESVIANFLAAYWACDGGIYDRRDLQRAGRSEGQFGTVRIDCCTVSEGLARDIQHLLGRLGLNFTLIRKSHKLISKRQPGGIYSAWYVNNSNQDAAAKFMQIIGPLMRHEKRTRAQGLWRTALDQILRSDAVRSIEPTETGACRCLTVEEDASFTIEDIAVHNSTIVSVCFPAWVWLHNPGWRAICVSGSEEIALRDSMKCRDVIESEWYQQTFKPTWTMAKDQNAKGHYINSAKGFRQATSSGTRITGKRANAILVDDPNDAAKTFSKAARDAIKQWWDHSAANRLSDMRTGIRCIIQQRLHEEDLTGHVNATEPKKWSNLVIRQEFEDGDGAFPDGSRDPRTAAGELMFPERWPIEIVDEERERLKEMGFAGQHQQRPVPASGNIFKRGFAQFYKPGSEPAFRRTIFSMDTAFKEKEENDYTVCLVLSEAQHGIYIQDRWKARVSYPDLREKARTMGEKWRPAVFLIEDKASGQSLIQDLQRDTRLPIRAVKVSVDKATRAHNATPTWESKRIYLPEGADWVDDFLEQLYGFPKMKNDDDVDAFTQAINYLDERPKMTINPSALARI